MFFYIVITDMAEYLGWHWKEKHKSYMNASPSLFHHEQGVKSVTRQTPQCVWSMVPCTLSPTGLSCRELVPACPWCSTLTGSSAGSSPSAASLSARSLGLWRVLWGGRTSWRTRTSTLRQVIPSAVHSPPLHIQCYPELLGPWLTDGVWLSVLSSWPTLVT